MRAASTGPRHRRLANHADHGSGTWLTISGHETPQAVTGGGNWATLDDSGTNSTGSGTYAVTGGVGFKVVPGNTPAAGTIDSIGSTDDSRSAFLSYGSVIRTGEEGVLTSQLPCGGTAPETIFEGITATKGFGRLR